MAVNSFDVLLTSMTWLLAACVGVLMSEVWLQDPNEEAPQFDVPNTEHKLRVMDTMSDREVHGYFS